MKDYRYFRKRFEQETGNDFEDVNILDGVTAVYIDWLEQRLESSRLTDLLEEIEKEIKHADECIEKAGNDEDKVADEGFKTAMKAVKAIIQSAIEGDCNE